MSNIYYKSSCVWLQSKLVKSLRSPMIEMIPSSKSPPKKETAEEISGFTVLEPKR